MLCLATNVAAVSNQMLLVSQQEEISNNNNNNNNDNSETIEKSQSFINQQKSHGFGLFNWLKDTFFGSIDNEQVILNNNNNNNKHSHTNEEEQQTIENDLNKVVSAMDFSQYENEVVLRFNWTSPREKRAFLKACKTLVLDVWKADVVSGDVRLHVSRVKNLLRLLPKSMRDKFSIMIPDLEHAVYATFPEVAAGGSSSSSSGSSNTDFLNKDMEFHAMSELFFKDYRPLSAIYTWLDILEDTYPSQVRKEIIGKTHEGRDLRVYHLYSSKYDKQEPSGKKKTIIISSGAHAREWISVTTTLYVLYQLLTNQKRLAERKILESLDFLIVPVLNPDGYQYTWEHDRLWRKNRQSTGVAICNGLDIDSSFPYHWAPSLGTPCSEGYAGQEPLEALEAYHLTNYINKTSEKHKYFGYLDFHSYSQSILYPYGYSCDEEPRDKENLLELAYGMAKVIRWTSGKIYDVLPLCHDREYDPEDGSGGCALDFMYKIHAIWAFQLKLRDTGNHGFLLPKKFIDPVGKEIYNSLKYFCDFILNPE